MRRLIAGGSDDTETADRLGVSPSTVKEHMTALFAELRVRDRTRAVGAAYGTGLVTARREA
ncbi:LuxR C-terminal-related transcriptional regulator [Streptomyces sp. NPDC056529]|uniref:LuxR C-terminal-related transcriptional regulator n=1 Tax=Streptomyces sp. NPDC056529 TaxID=3345855 RepID=UPI00368AA926